MKLRNVENVGSGSTEVFSAFVKHELMTLFNTKPLALELQTAICLRLGLHVWLFALSSEDAIAGGSGGTAWPVPGKEPHEETTEHCAVAQGTEDKT